MTNDKEDITSKPWSKEKDFFNPQPLAFRLNLLVKWKVLFCILNLVMWVVLAAKYRYDTVDDLICIFMIPMWIWLTIFKIRST